MTKSARCIISLCGLVALACLGAALAQTPAELSKTLSKVNQVAQVQSYAIERMKKESAYQTSATTPKQHYDEHLKDIQMCLSGFEYLNQNEKEFERLSSGASVTQTLRQSRFASNPAISHILRYPTRFALGTSCHTGGLSAYGPACTYCDVEVEFRVKKIESFGANQFGWLLRLEAMNSALKELDYPFCEACYGIEFDRFFAQLKTVQSIYGSTNKRDLNAWLKAGAREIRKHKTKAAEGAAGKTLKEQIATIEQLAQRLEQLAQL